MSRFAPKHRPMRQLARVHAPAVTSEEAKPRYGQGRGGRPWRRIVERIKARDRYTCQICRRLTESGEVDHVIPLSKGGTDDDDNLQYLCGGPRGCHATKTAQEMGHRPRSPRRIGRNGLPVED